MGHGFLRWEGYSLYIFIFMLLYTDLYFLVLWLGEEDAMYDVRDLKGWLLWRSVKEICARLPFRESCLT